MPYRSLVLLMLGVALAGCATEDGLQTNGVTTRAGNAIAANTVMQMVDPWQIGVDDTDLRTPADRGDTDAGGDTPPVTPAPTQ